MEECKETCATCKRNISHGGKCCDDKGNYQVCLGYEKDPRGKLLYSSGHLAIDDDFIIGEWTKYQYGELGENEVYRKIKPIQIRGIKYEKEFGEYRVHIYFCYFENDIEGDKEDAQELERIKFKKYLKENNITNVVIFRPMQKLKDKF